MWMAPILGDPFLSYGYILLFLDICSYIIDCHVAYMLCTLRHMVFLPQSLNSIFFEEEKFTAIARFLILLYPIY